MAVVSVHKIDGSLQHAKERSVPVLLHWFDLICDLIVLRSSHYRERHAISSPLLTL